MTLARYAVAYDEGAEDALKDHRGELTEAKEIIKDLTRVAEDYIQTSTKSLDTCNEYALRLFGPGWEDNEHV